MSEKQLSAMLINAVIDSKFCQHLLQDPREALQNYELTPAEVQALASFRAHTLEEFAGKMVDWLNYQEMPRTMMSAG